MGVPHRDFTQQLDRKKLENFDDLIFWMSNSKSFNSKSPRFHSLSFVNKCRHSCHFFSPLIGAWSRESHFAMLVVWYCKNNKLSYISTLFFEHIINYLPTCILAINFSLACVAGARKGKGDRKIGCARNARCEGEGKRLQPVHCLFRLALSFICKQLTATTVCLSNVSHWKYCLFFAGTRSGRKNVGLNMNKPSSVISIQSRFDASRFDTNRSRFETTSSKSIRYTQKVDSSQLFSGPTGSPFSSKQVCYQRLNSLRT